MKDIIIFLLLLIPALSILIRTKLFFFSQKKIEKLQNVLLLIKKLRIFGKKLNYINFWCLITNKF